MIYTKWENLHRYVKDIPALEEIIEIIYSGDLLSKDPGGYITSSGLKYSVQEYEPKDESDKIYEFHAANMDVQVMVKGIEKCKHAAQKGDPSAVDQDKDFGAIETGSDEECLLKEGSAVIYFPLEVHKPGIKVQDGVVRKVVFKVPYSD